MTTFSTTRVQSRLAQIARRTAYAAPGLGTLTARMRPRACVLAYHRVATATLDPAGQAVTPERFTEHLRLFANEYRVVALHQLVAEAASATLEDRTVAITFDDGYADTLTAAAPIAAQHSIPIHVFVTVRPVLVGGLFWWDELTLLVDADAWPVVHAELKLLPEAERFDRLRHLGDVEPDDARRDGLGRPLTPSELRRLARLPNVGIGSHSLTHASLAALPASEQRRELEDARLELERLLEQPVTTVSYPFGKDPDVGPETLLLAEQSGYQAAFTSSPRALTRRSPRFALPRLTAHDWSADELRRRLRSYFGR